MHKQILTSVVALPFLFACFQDDPTAGTSDDETETGDGDGDPSTGDGDGDPSTGDGDGDPTTGDGDGDGDPTTGDGDGDGDPTTGDGDGDGDPLPECGNGMVEADEACDDGDANALEPGACAPDCSTIIATKRLAMSTAVDGTSFQPNAVGYADSRCAPGFKAMFGFGTMRVATTVPWQSVNSVDWPVKPYTAYTTMDGDLVWVTDDVALLAIRDGAHVEPVNPVFQCGGMFCIVFSMLSGLADDGTTSLSNTCNGWTSVLDNVSLNYGSLTTLEYQTGTTACTALDPDVISLPRFLCVEQ